MKGEYSVLKRISALALAVLLTLMIVSVIPGGMLRAAAEDAVEISETNFPDSNFRQYVTDYCDTDSDGILSVSEIADVTAIDVNYKGITDLKGIEYFTALTELDCSNNQLTALDLSRNTELRELVCAYNYNYSTHERTLADLDVSQNPALSKLNCTGNLLEDLNVRSNTALTELSCSSNSMQELDVSQNTALTELNCSDNELTSLNVEQNTALTKLNCSKNQLSSLDLSQNAELSDLDCSENQMESLNVSQNTALEELSCRDNVLTELDVSANTALSKLDCADNQLENLNLGQNTALTILDCSNNKLTNLDVSKNSSLSELNCSNNMLTSLSVEQNPSLSILSCSENQLTDLDVSQNTALTILQCRSNQLSNLDLSQNTALTKLYCSENSLKNLDLSKNTALEILYCENNSLASLNLDYNPNLETYDHYSEVITLPVTEESGKYVVDLKKYDSSLDPERIQELSGGTLNTATGKVTFNSWPGAFTYQYRTVSGAPNKYMNVKVCDAGHLITFVEFNVSEPAVGANPSKPTGNSGSPYSVSVNDTYGSTGWAEIGKYGLTPVAETDTFESGTQYRLSVTFTAAAGYTFAPYSEISYMINGVKYPVSSLLGASGTSLAVSFDFLAHTHTFTHYDKIEATCTSEGRIEYWECSLCGRKYRDEEGKTEVTHITIPTLQHPFGDWIVDTEATEATEGTRHRDCTVCGYREKRRIPRIGEQRIYGHDRFDTSIKIADALKEAICVEKFNTIVVASSIDFPDALSGAYLAEKKEAPILIVNEQNVEKIVSYIKENTESNATVYILGGPAVVPTSLETSLQGYTCKRLYGHTRYDTNLEILYETGVQDGSEVLVCSGMGYADALAASATGKPILLVSKELTKEQIKFLEGRSNLSFTILGGEGAVPASLEQELEQYGTVERLSGKNRYETASLTAEKFFSNPCSTVVLTYGLNYPDGLCGGPLAYAYGAPLLLLTNQSNTQEAPKEAARYLGADRAVILGGPTLISDESARYIYYES